MAAAPIDRRTTAAGLDDHLFRRESGRMVAALTRAFGVHNLSLAEDVVQDAFCRALATWRIRGVPENPSAWLMTTAKNRALDVFRRELTERTFAPELSRCLDSERIIAPAFEELFAVEAVKDDLLRMMFSCCHPRLSEAAQVGLILHILCGFGIGEIAGAFVSREAAVQKRITRAKKMLAASKRLFDIASAIELARRLPAVQRTLYLLFNEGYHGASQDAAVRSEMCHEAMRLTVLLLDDPRTATPASYALGALMWLTAARLPARTDVSGNLIPLLEQDRSRWDYQLLAEGFRCLELSAAGSEITPYHLEAAIASIHASARCVEDTDWRTIVSFYDALMALRPSPVVALNRAIAVAQDNGPERGLAELAAIADSERLAPYPFYRAALGDLELRRGRRNIACDHFRAALALARNSMERRFLDRRVAECERTDRTAQSTN